MEYAFIHNRVYLFLQNVGTIRERLASANITRFHIPGKSILDPKMESDAAYIQVECYINHPAGFKHNHSITQVFLSIAEHLWACRPHTILWSSAKHIAAVMIFSDCAHNTYCRLLNRQKSRELGLGLRLMWSRCMHNHLTVLVHRLTESSVPCTWWITTSWESRWQYQLGELLERETAHLNIATTTCTWVTNLQITNNKSTFMFSVFIIMSNHPHISVIYQDGGCQTIHI